VEESGVEESGVAASLTVEVSQEIPPHLITVDSLP
jgi:hypothetical protein